MTKKFNFEEVKEKAVRLADKHLEQGLEEIENGEGMVAVAQEPSAAEPQPTEKPAESKKGVQTYIPMSMYRRLNDIKLTRRENIAALVAQAIELWLDVQEGKQKVSATI